MSPQPETAPAVQEFSSEERKILLELAHQSIIAALEGRSISLEPPVAHLAEPRGVFTTLYLHRQLRGCVGQVFTTTSLYRSVAETSQAAAFHDPRFPALTNAEAPLLKVSLSVLSGLKPIRPEEIEIGKHGLLVSQGGNRGLLLPQVSEEHGWDRIQFLQETCRKAGLPKDAWQQAKLESFTAEVFSDQE